MTAILGTDNDHHAEHMAEITSLIADGFDWANPRHQSVALTIALHAADVSNPTKEWSIYGQWSERVTEEFFLQGDAERSHEIDVTPFYDRQRPPPAAKFQLGFISFIVMPLYREFAKLPEVEVALTPLATLEANEARWKGILMEEEAEPEWAQRLTKTNATISEASS